MLDSVSKEDIEKFESLRGVIEDLQRTIEQYDAHLSENETRTRQFLIDPLLGELDWDVLDPDDVQLEYGVKSDSGTKRLNYVLALDDWPIAIVEAKRLNCKPNWTKEAKRTKKILNNAPFQEDIRYIIVTDGNRWLIYEAFEVRLIMSFELYNESSAASALQVLQIWKWKSKSASGSPIEIITPVPDSSDNRMKDDLDDLSPAKQLYLEYWTALKNYFEGREERNSDIKFRKPQPQNEMGFAIGRSDFQLATLASRDKLHICVSLMVKGTHGRSHFDRLKMSKTEIKRESGHELKWEPNPKENNIRLYLKDTDLEDRDDWERQHQWLCEQLETFHKVFKPRVREL